MIEPHKIDETIKLQETDKLGLEGTTIPHFVIKNLKVSSGPASALLRENVIVYLYPATGVEGRDPAPGWDNVPGAVGCTVQSLGFKTLHEKFKKLGWEVVGVTSQNSMEQSEFAQNNGIPYSLLSDHDLGFANALNLPTFQIANQTFLKRMILVVKAGVIQKVFYPIESPRESASRVLSWLLAESYALGSEQAT